MLFRESLPKEARRSRRRRVRGASLCSLSRPALARFVGVMFLMITAQALMEIDVRPMGRRELALGAARSWLDAWRRSASARCLLQGGGAGRAARTVGERMTLLIGLGADRRGFGGMAVAHSKSRRWPCR